MYTEQVLLMFFTDTATTGRFTDSLKMTQRARFLEKFKAAKVIFKYIHFSQVNLICITSCTRCVKNFLRKSVIVTSLIS